MVKKSHGFRSKTREKLSQKSGKRPAITGFLKKIEKNQKVLLIPEPSSQKGMPHPRFKGKMGKVIDKRGKSYIIEIIDGKKRKLIVSRPEHLRVV